MPALLDIIGSVLIGGMIILIVFNANIITSENWQVYNNTMLVQEMLISTAMLLEGELRNMGYNVHPDGAGGNPEIVVEATDTSITFRTDLNKNGVPDSVKYWLGPPGELNVQNERMRILYRSVSLNNHQVNGVGYVTDFRMQYFNKQGDTLTTPVSLLELSQIYEVEIAIEVQNPYGVYQEGVDEDLYATSFWRQTRLLSKNLNR